LNHVFKFSAAKLRQYEVITKTKQPKKQPLYEYLARTASPRRAHHLHAAGNHPHNPLKPTTLQ